MSITLKIISYQRLTPGQQELFQTDLDRFSIGRNTDNHWTLPDPQRFMSGTHCWLKNRNGTWFVTDTSTNGVFINGSDQRLTKNDSVELSHADRIRLGDYDLEIDLQGSDRPTISSPDISSDPFQNDVEDIFALPEAPRPTASADQKEVNTPLSQMDSSLLGDSVSIDDLYELDDGAQEQEQPPTLASQGDQVSPLSRHFTAPEVAQEQRSSLPDQYAADLDAIPENWDEETGLVKTPVRDESEDLEPVTVEPPALQPTPVIKEPTPPASPAPEPAPPASQAREPAPTPRAEPPPRPDKRTRAGSAIEAFASGAGLALDQLQVADEEEFFHDLGVLLNTMTEGLMQAIASRSQIKSEFRLEQTMIAPTENNPFKFSVSAQEAMSRLLNRASSAYLSGPAAAAEAIDDINAHQMAVMAGTEAALKSILHRFRPATLESRFDGDSILVKALPFLKKARYWEFYKILYDEVSEAADDDFQQYFGTEFSNAYEKQLDLLKISRKEKPQ
jgi:type VI secretion system protein